ncbi:6-phosphogluconate dehydrogenase, decarboxylating 2 [Camellia lanceoleosa]|uniref:6-phosphogluconate dehydrogenase, decarboxylating 2 n=1 Tax=Camellia lanceoleosa TaxID=1840588 RepID=A0ACC0G6K4_9ERIC|nr:6-phosphogluconate dehydrogenase, decarboxylating 2 [Camellia lanceoleosa]
MLVKAGSPVDQTVKTLSVHMEKGDCIIDGERAMAELGLLYLGMEVSSGVAGARHGPSLMPGSSFEAYKYIEDIFLKVAAQVCDSGYCVTYIRKGGYENFVKMIHNGIEYGDMQLIVKAYDVLKSVSKLSNEELHQVFSEWNKGELLSFLIEITADIFSIKDDKGDGYLVDKVLDKTGMKDTVAAPTIASSLNSRFLSGLKDERVQAAKIFKYGGVDDIFTYQAVNKQKLIDDVRQALYVSKICKKGWDLELGELARNWKGGCCIILVCLAINSGISTPGMSSSFAYFDTCRRERLLTNLVQAQRDYFGAHTYERIDMPGAFHTGWFKITKQSKN